MVGEVHQRAGVIVVITSVVSPTGGRRFATATRSVVSSPNRTLPISLRTMALAPNELWQRLARRPPRFAPPRNAQLILRDGSEMTGRLDGGDVVWISGSFSGDVSANDLMVIADDAVVRGGHLTAPTIEIYGTVETGDIEASRSAVLHGCCSVHASVDAPTLIVREGADFSGESAMPEPDEDADAECPGEDPRPRAAATSVSGDPWFPSARS